MNSGSSYTILSFKAVLILGYLLKDMTKVMFQNSRLY